MDRLLIWLVVVAALAALCLVRPNVGRLVVGCFFIAMALGVHGAILLVDPQSYVTFAGGAYLPLYRDVAVRVVTANPVLFGLAVAAFELAVALLVLQKGRAVTLGLAGMALFLVGIVPLGVEEAPCLLLAAALAHLATKRFDASFAELVRARLHRRRSLVAAAVAPTLR